MLSGEAGARTCTVADQPGSEDFIFYPCIPYERSEFADADNHYNCPIVTSYAENIKNNMDPIVHGEVDFMNPFLTFESEETISDRLVEEFSKKFSSRSEIKSAVHDVMGRTCCLSSGYQKKG